MSTYEKVKEWRAKNKDKVNEQARRYRKRHPETNKKAKDRYRSKNIDRIREADKINQDKRRKSDPDAQKVRYERWKIKKEAKLWDLAGRPRSDKCDICESEGITVFDHCHQSGHFRGWLCGRCNRTLGVIKDSPSLLQKMVNYLEKFHGQINGEKKECIT